MWTAAATYVHSETPSTPSGHSRNIIQLEHTSLRTYLWDIPSLYLGFLAEPEGVGDKESKRTSSELI